MTGESCVDLGCIKGIKGVLIEGKKACDSREGWWVSATCSCGTKALRPAPPRSSSVVRVVRMDAWGHGGSISQGMKSEMR